MDLEEFDMFYDFSKDNEQFFLRTVIGNHNKKTKRRRAKKQLDGANIRGGCKKTSQWRTLAQWSRRI